MAGELPSVAIDRRASEPAIPSPFPKEKSGVYKAFEGIEGGRDPLRTIRTTGVDAFAADTGAQCRYIRRIRRLFDN